MGASNWQGPGGAAGLGAGTLWVPTLATPGTPTADPNSLLVSASQDAAGWITAEVDTTATQDNIDAGVSWDLAEILDVTGADIAGESIHEYAITLALEFQDDGSPDTGAVLLMQGSTGNDVGIASRDSGTGLGRRACAERQSGSLNQSPALTGIRHIVSQLHPYTVDDQFRGEGAIGLDSAGAFVVGATASAITVYNFGTFAGTRIGVIVPGTTGVSGATETIVFRPRVWIQPYSRLLL